MKIAVEGCAHGDLERIYDSISYLEEQEKFKVDLLLCCGDFQATRNVHDLNSMSVPPKYREMCTFYKYYSGEKAAPVLTIFIGGNHEASNYLQELPYGGWVAPSIYYLGYAGVINVAGVRIGGLSGIYKSNDFMLGRFERPPYNENSKRSIYHIRNLEIFRLKQLKQPIDIFLSHDWPRGVHKYGNVNRLLRFKKHFKEDIESNKLGSPPTEEILYVLKPKYWFSAHLHCKFAAVIPHKNGDKKEITKFLALDKCLPKRKFLQVLDVEHDSGKPIEIEYDPEWLSVLHFTNHLISYKRDMNILPNKDFAQDNIRWDFTPTEVEIDFVHAKMSSDFVVPQNFKKTAPAYVPGQPPVLPSPLTPNLQTQAFCQRIGISDMFEEILGLESDLNKRSSQESYGSQGRSSQGSPLARGSTTPFNSFVESDLGNGSSTSSEEQELDNTQTTSSGWDSDISPLKAVLTLPPPKNSQEPLETLTEGLTSPLSQDCVSSKSPQPNEDTPFVIDTSPISTQKTFKRRNQAIYKSPDEDES